MQTKFFSPHALSADLGLLFLRIFSAAAFLTHGWAKLQNVLAGHMEFADPIGLGPTATLYLAIFSELVCAICILLGLFTRIAVIPPLITMVIAFVIVHHADLFNVKELAFLYFGMFATLFFTGPGRISVDRIIFK